MIRQAKLLFFLAVVLFAGLGTLGAWVVAVWHFSGTDEQLTAAVSSRDGEINQLQEELRGSSPQLAAIQAGRDRVRNKLQTFYVEGSRLFAVPPQADKDLPNYQRRVEAWGHNVDTWVLANMGDAAQAKIFDPGNGSGVVWTGYGDQQSNIRNFIIMVRRNLSTLIETAAWDGSVAKPKDTP